MITVDELRRKLALYDGNLPVFVDGISGDREIISVEFDDEYQNVVISGDGTEMG